MDVIKVRGKNKRTRGAPDVARSSGRPMKHSRDLAKGRNITKKLLLQITTSRPRQNLTELEKLPAELLEHIFFYAEEVSLPQASLHIGKTLSSERIYRNILIRAFGGTRSRGAFSKERQNLQSAIVNTKWCTVDRIKRSLPSMAKSALKHAWHSCCEQNESLRGQKINNTLSDIMASVEEMQLHFNATNDQCTFRFACSCGFESASRKEFPIFQVSTIPESVIRRSVQSEEHLEMLRLLRQGWRQGWKFYDDTVRVQSLIPKSKCVFETMAQAITKTNWSALLTLAELAVVINVPCLLDIPINSPHVSHSDLGISSLPPELFRIAAQAPQAAKYLKILIRLDADSLPRDDANITQWATKTRDEGGDEASFAEWLLHVMERGFPRHEKPFEYGAPNEYVPRDLFLSHIPSMQRACTFDVECEYDLSIFDYDHLLRYIWVV
ncbi:MAG: hypothetical protein Q9160_001118 [Pyrenula sp. 1 TL-2023]